MSCAEESSLRDRGVGAFRQSIRSEDGNRCEHPESDLAAGPVGDDERLRPKPMYIDDIVAGRHIVTASMTNGSRANVAPLVPPLHCAAGEHALRGIERRSTGKYRHHLERSSLLIDIAAPSAAEPMLTGAGFEVLERCRRVSTIEWPDAQLAWHALSSTGPAVPALHPTRESSKPPSCKRSLRVATAVAPTGSRRTTTTSSSPANR